MEPDVDLEQVSIKALRSSACTKLSSMLNVPKIIPTADGLFRDWRGLAELLDLDSATIRMIETKPDPISEILSLWPKNGTIHELTLHLKTLDRFDVLDDTIALLVQDSHVYLKKKDDLYDPESIDSEQDCMVLTIGDSARLVQGLQLERYDAFLLYAEDDTDFAMEMVRKMEDDYGMKFCLRDRDLVGGLQFEHDAIAKLIEERCNRLVVIFSPSFIESKANQFVLMFAQALGIEQRERKIIPCVYKHCDLPATIRCAFCLDYTRSGKLWNFWERLRDSLQAPLPQGKVPRSIMAAQSKESSAQPVDPSVEVKPDKTNSVIKEKVGSTSRNKVPGCKLTGKVKRESDADSGLCSQSSSNSTESALKVNTSELGKPVPISSWFKRLLPKQVEQKDRKLLRKKLLAE